MSDFTRTPNLQLYKPTPQADADVWGDHWNANADTLDTAIISYIPLTQRAAVNGVATLDSTGKVPVTQLPGFATGTMSYRGGWDASTNTPAMASGALAGGVKQNAGNYYVVLVGASTAAIDGVTTWVAGDWISSSGTVWQRVQTSGSGFLPLSGGTVVGPLTLNNTTSNGGIYGAQFNSTNNSATPGTGSRVSYLSFAGNGGFDVAFSSFATFDMTAIAGQVPYKMGGWFVAVSPNDPTNYFATVVAEWNVVNRGADTGWITNLASASSYTGGLVMVPEAKSFGASGGGEGKNATFAFAVSSSGTNNSTGDKVRWYNGLLISQNSIVGQTGRGIYMTGDVLGSPTRYPFGPMGMAGTWLHGIDHTAATYTDNQAETFKVGQSIAWVYGTAAAPVVTASITGSSGGANASLTLMTVGTGGVFLGDGTGARTLTFNGAAASSSGLQWQDNSVLRWAFSKAATTANLGLFAYDAAGAFIGQALTITPAGHFTLPGGINLGNVAGASTTDLSKGIDFYQGSVGFNLTAARLNYVVPSGNAHTFVVNAVDMASIASAGLRVIGNVGFNNTAPVAKPTVAGACAGNTAVKALLTALAAYGLVTDTTTA